MGTESLFSGARKYVLKLFNFPLSFLKFLVHVILHCNTNIIGLLLLCLPTFVFSLADVTYQAPILFSLQNFAICSTGTAGQGMSHLFANKTTGIFVPSGSVTFSLKSDNHFLIDWNVAIRDISNTNAAATLYKIE